MTTKKADTGKVRGNQTPNTPNVNESDRRKRGDTGKQPGNQTPNTPNRRESEERKGRS